MRNRTVRAKAEGVEYPTLKGKTVRQVRFANDEDFSAIVIEFDDNTLVSFRLKANIALSMEPELSITKGGNIISWKILKARPVVRRARRVFHAYTHSMCGRYRLARKKEILAEVFDVGDDDDWSPRYNIAPSQSVPVVRQDATRPIRSFSLMRWGLIPFWAKDAKAGYKMINARAETIAEKPAFREPLLSRRCLIPADGFYEWSKSSKGKAPFCLTLADDSVFAFAGIWDRWRNPERELIETCSIITTAANALLSDIHDRMPVILKSEDHDRWLDPGFKHVDDILDLLKPYPPDSMRRYRVSTRVNSAQNDDPACMEEYILETLF